MPTTREKVAKLVDEGYLTEKQGDKLTPNYALIVGERNKWINTTLYGILRGLFVTGTVIQSQMKNA